MFILGWSLDDGYLLQGGRGLVRARTGRCTVAHAAVVWMHREFFQSPTTVDSAPPDPLLFEHGFIEMTSEFDLQVH